MHTSDFTTFLLRLPDDCKEIVSETVFQFHLPQRHHTCPACGSEHTCIDRYRKQTLKGIPDTDLTYIYRNRRYRCQECGKTFSERRPFLDRYQRMPISIIENLTKEHGEPVSSSFIARRHRVSTTTVMRHFAKAISEEKQETEILPTVISLDEFRGNVAAKYQVAIQDLCTRSCLDILPDRTGPVLRQEFQTLPQEERNKVRIVAIDLSTFFKNLVIENFPNAEIAADKFHAVRLANDALNDIRLSIQNTLKGAARQTFKSSRRLLLARHATLTEKAKLRLNEILSLSKSLEAAYNLKEDYFNLFTSPTRKDFRKKLDEFIEKTQKADLKPFNTLRETTILWKEEIWCGIRTGYTNGFTEGCNNTIKVLKRVCYGFRNFQNFRRRILYLLNNPARKKRRSIVVDN